MQSRQAVFVSMLAAVLATSVALAVVNHRGPGEPASFPAAIPAEPPSDAIRPQGGEPHAKQALHRAAPETDYSGFARPARGQPVELSGRIDGEMAAKVSDALSAGHRDFTINRSNGGYVLAAATMAGMMSSYNARLTADGTCLSACVLLLIGVRDHYYVPGTADIQIHGAFRKDSPADTKPASDAADFMVANGVPRAIAYGPGMGINFHRLSTAELDSIGILPAGQQRALPTAQTSAVGEEAEAFACGSDPRTRQAAKKPSVPCLSGESLR